MAFSLGRDSLIIKQYIQDSVSNQKVKDIVMRIYNYSYGQNKRTTQAVMNQILNQYPNLKENELIEISNSMQDISNNADWRTFGIGDAFEYNTIQDMLKTRINRISDQRQRDSGRRQKDFTDRTERDIEKGRRLTEREREELRDTLENVEDLTIEDFNKLTSRIEETEKETESRIDEEKGLIEENIDEILTDFDRVKSGIYDQWDINKQNLIKKYGITEDLADSLIGNAREYAEQPSIVDAELEAGLAANTEQAIKRAIAGRSRFGGLQIDPNMSAHDRMSMNKERIAAKLREGLQRFQNIQSATSSSANIRKQVADKLSGLEKYTTNLQSGLEQFKTRTASDLEKYRGTRSESLERFRTATKRATTQDLGYSAVNKFNALLGREQTKADLIRDIYSGAEAREIGRTQGRIGLDSLYRANQQGNIDFIENYIRSMNQEPMNVAQRQQDARNRKKWAIPKAVGAIGAGIAGAAGLPGGFQIAGTLADSSIDSWIPGGEDLKNANRRTAGFLGKNTPAQNQGPSQQPGINLFQSLTQPLPKTNVPVEGQGQQLSPSILDQLINLFKNKNVQQKKLGT